MPNKSIAQPSVKARPFILTPHDRIRLRNAILATLKRGKNNAIKGSELARLLGERDDRRARVAIRELIKEGVPIASSVTEPMGFFIVANEFEASNYIRVLKERIKQDTSRLEDFERAVSNYTIPEQLSIF